VDAEEDDPSVNGLRYAVRTKITEDGVEVKQCKGSVIRMLRPLGELKGERLQYYQFDLQSQPRLT
jgi:hypothetical protein